MRQQAIIAIVATVAAAGIAASAPSVAAQDVAPSEQGESSAATVLTLEEALQRADNHSHQIRQGAAEIERSQWALAEARAGRLPTLNVDGNYTNNVILPFIVLPPDSPFGSSVLETGTQHNFSATAQVSVPLYSAQLNRGIEVSQASKELQEALYEATLGEVDREVQRAFLNGLISREALRVLRESQDTLEANLELISALYEEGAAPEYDLLRTEVQVRNLEPELARARNSHEGALNYLKLLTGIDIDEPIELAGSLESIYESIGDPDLPRRFENNRDLIELAGQEEIVARRLEAERAAYWPTLSAFGNYSYQGQGDDLAFWDYDWADTASVGLAVSIPLLNPGRLERINQVEVEYRQLQMQRDFVEDSLRTEYETTRNRLQELAATIDAQERTIDQAQRGYDIARASYEEGVHNLMEVNDAESALREAQLNYKNALNDYLNAVLDLEELVGSDRTSTTFGPW